MAESDQTPTDPTPNPRRRPTAARAAAVARRAAGRAGRVAGRVASAIAHPGRARRHPVLWRAATVLAVLAVGVGGAVLGILLFGRTGVDVGPFHAEMRLSPSASGGSQVNIPPLGALHLATHAGPAHLSITLDSLDQRRTEELITDPNAITRASQTAVSDVTNGVIRLSLRTLAVAVLTGLLLAALIFRRVRLVAWSGTVALATTAASLGIAAGTFRVGAIEEPRYTGLLVNAPAVVGDARRIADRYDQYAAQLQSIVGNVSRLYTTVSTLPVYQPNSETTRVLHVSDLHLNPTAWSLIRTVVEQFDIDVVIDTGDINDWGSEPEASFVDTIALLRVPYVYIRGNHDSYLTERAVARQRNAIVLDNSIRTVAGLTIAGIGDPRFTPDKQESPPGSGSLPGTIDSVLNSGRQLADTIHASGRQVDIALVHDPASAGALAGVCPLVLAGHLHNRTVSELDPPPGSLPGTKPTRLLVEGSTGGAGLRGLEGEQPTPLAMSVLYFDRLHALQAYDDITVGGTGQSQVELKRHLVGEPQPAGTATQAPPPAQSPPPTPTR
ncbi:metallophosphoesterase family protein [Rhizomonospora bruguierae]|uniref:metallophosphoesterase family protein n=1 Tax=Rhizomonospora bruguierae TaxID=1581705 RepID=UPI001BCCA7F4|nr:metallophosphoesterase [Micromonospora sp. NBRC 107566]